MTPAAKLLFGPNQILDERWNQVIQPYQLSQSHPNTSVISIGCFKDDNNNPQRNSSYGISDVFVLKVPEVKQGTISDCQFSAILPDEAELPARFNARYNWNSLPIGLFSQRNTFTPTLNPAANPGSYTVTLSITVPMTNGIKDANGVLIYTPYTYTSTAVVNKVVSNAPILVCSNGDIGVNTIPLDYRTCNINLGPNIIYNHNSWELSANIPIGSSRQAIRSYLSVATCSNTNAIGCTPVVVFPDLLVQQTNSVTNFTNCQAASQTTLPIFSIPATVAGDLHYRVKVYSIEQGTSNRILKYMEDIYGANWTPNMLDFTVTGKLEIEFLFFDEVMSQEAPCTKVFTYNATEPIQIPLLDISLDIKDKGTCGTKGNVNVELTNNSTTLAPNGLTFDVQSTDSEGNQQFITGLNANQTTDFDLEVTSATISSRNYIDITISYTYEQYCPNTYTRRYYFKDCCDQDIQEWINRGYQVIGTDPEHPVFIHSDEPTMVLSGDYIILSPIIVDKGAVLTIDHSNLKFKGRGSFTPENQGMYVPYYVPGITSNPGIYLSPENESDPYHVYDPTTVNNTGHHLTVTNSTLEAACNDMWGGIHGPELVLEEHLVTINNSVVRDATCAYIEDMPNQLAIGGPIAAFQYSAQIINNDIYNCLDGIRLAGASTNMDVDILQNKFFGSTNLLFPYDQNNAFARAKYYQANDRKYLYRSGIAIELVSFPTTYYGQPHRVKVEQNYIDDHLIGIRTGATTTDLDHTHYNFYCEIDNNEFENIYLAGILNQNSRFYFPNIYNSPFIGLGGTENSDKLTDFYYTEQIEDLIPDLGMYGANGSYLPPTDWWHSIGIKSESNLGVFDCQFQGSNPSRSIGLQTFRNTLNANRSTFNDLKHGIVTYNALGGAYNCVFTSCRESVYMGPYGTAGQYLNSKLDLRCNFFNPGTNHWSGTDQIGLFIEPTVQLGDIGGPITSGNSLSRPNSNIWPTAGARPSVKYTQDGVNGWSSPGDWISIAYSGNTDKNYFRFSNEFIGNTSFPNASSFINTTQTECYMQDNIPSPIQANQVQVCTSVPSPGGVPYFPLRIGITKLEDENPTFISLYPQPCSDYLIVEGDGHIPVGTSSLAVFSLLGQIHRIPCIVTSIQATLDTRELPSGCYYLKSSSGKTIKFIKR
jgi:hypothetical protein